MDLYQPLMTLFSFLCSLLTIYYSPICYTLSMEIKNKLQRLVKEAVGGLGIEAPVVLEHPTESSHGDYFTNVAMKIFPSLITKPLTRPYQSPLELAEEIARRIKESGISELVDKVEVVPPGFINFWLLDQMLKKELTKALDQGYGSGKSDKTIVVDYSAPNIAKPFGIGHLRSTIIGQAIYNLYKFLGWNAVGDNHLGDWGTQFGALLYQATSKKLDVNSLTVGKLEEIYVEFNKKAQENPELKDEARGWFKKLEEGDAGVRKVWEKLKEISLEEFNRIYKLLGVKIDYALGESFYQNMLEKVISETIDKGIAVEDQGALIVNLSKEGLPPALIRKSDGVSTYLTRDLATVKYRLEKWDPDLIVYEVGAEQDLHFKQLFAVVKLLGWSSSTQFLHVKHGLYLSAGGKKFSTRRGETIHLEDVLKEAIERARNLSDADTDKDTEMTANAVGIGAIKYFDLSHHPATNIVFEWEKMFALEGNSAAYLQYTYARTRSVLARDRVRDREPLDTLNQILNLPLNPEELAILRTFYKFPEVVREAAGSFSPNLLCNFLFDLAQKYNAFYNKHRILEDVRQDESTAQYFNSPVSIFRLAITEVTGNMLRTGLGILGIAVTERM